MIIGKGPPGISITASLVEASQAYLTFAFPREFLTFSTSCEKISLSPRPYLSARGNFSISTISFSWPKARSQIFLSTPKFTDLSIGLVDKFSSLIFLPLETTSSSLPRPGSELELSADDPLLTSCSRVAFLLANRWFRSGKSFFSFWSIQAIAFNKAVSWSTKKVCTKSNNNC